MSFGIPLVAAGLTEDKADVNARVAWSGVGINLATNEPTPQALRAAVRTVLDTPNYRSRASLMAAEFEAMDTRSEIVRIVDRIARSANRETQQHCATSSKPSGALVAVSRRATDVTQYPIPEILP
jgi:UDP:flavonoid glycosyltransferase YjiC (YdhE family)